MLVFRDFGLRVRRPGSSTGRLRTGLVRKGCILGGTFRLRCPIKAGCTAGSRGPWPGSSWYGISGGTSPGSAGSGRSWYAWRGRENATGSTMASRSASW